MSNVVDTFKYYASKLNLSKPQLEAVTDCFKACFEADGDAGFTPTATKKPDATTPSEDRKKHVPFEGNLPWAEETDHVFELPSYMKNRKAKVANMSDEDKHRIFGYGQNAAEGNFENIVNTEEELRHQKEEALRQQREAKMRRNMNWQKLLNKELGLNMPVDGIWGKQTQAAYEEYQARKKNPRVAQGMTREPEQVRTAGPVQDDVTKVNSPLTQVAHGNREPIQTRETGPASVDINNVNGPLTQRVQQVAQGSSRSPIGGRYGSVPRYGTPISANVDWRKAASQGTNFNYASPLSHMQTEQNASSVAQPFGMTPRHEKWEKVAPKGMIPRG